jgi:acyl carrier protein
MTNALHILKSEIKQLIIDVLGLEDLTKDDLADDTLLFGEEGLGLDSIDALELGVALRKTYQIHLEANSANNRQYFQSVNTLAELVQKQQASA